VKRIILTILLLSIFPFLIVIWVWFQIPSEKEIKGCLTTQMFQVDLCPTKPTYSKLRQISPYLQKAIVLTEDSLFWEHRGFDWNSIQKNYEENKKAGRYKRGGSTITQQLAKNMFLTADKTLIRKGLEALITMKIEKTLSKKEILERYLNMIEFGNKIYGVQKASRHYFNKSPSQLSIVESAFLAMLLPNPKKYSASFYRKELTPFASKRVRQIINQMYQFNRISEIEYGQSLIELESFFNPQNETIVNTDEAEDLNQLTLEKLELESEQEDRF